MPDNVSALQLVLTGDPALMAIVRLSLLVSLSAVVFGALIGVPVGAAVALTRFRGREAVIVILNALMGLPPVVVGLVVYLLLSRGGPLGSWGILFTPQAMIIAQTVLIAPIIAALARQTIEDLATEYRDELAAMDVGPLGRIATLIWDGRFSLVTAPLAGFGPRHDPAITLETSKGNCRSHRARPRADHPRRRSQCRGLVSRRAIEGHKEESIMPMRRSLFWPRPFPWSPPGPYARRTNPLWSPPPR